jgi:hypothetical protein
MTAPVDSPPHQEEVDLWWGSFAGRTLTPSFVVCGLLTAIIFACVRVLVPERGWLQLTFFGFAGAVWLVQLTRWGYRFFTYNYRLTTRYLYVDRGVRPLIARRCDLRSVERIEVCSSKFGKWLGVGDVWVFCDEAAAPPLVLEGLCAPRRAAEIIHDAVRKARENHL